MSGIDNQRLIALAAMAEEVKKGSKAPATLENYKNSVKRAIAFFQETDPSGVEISEIIINNVVHREQVLALPLTIKQLDSFLMSTAIRSYKIDEAGNMVILKWNHYGNVENNLNGVKWDYTVRLIPFAETKQEQQAITDLLNGYKRKCCKLKKSGQLTDQSKNAFTFPAFHRVTVLGNVPLENDSRRPSDPYDLLFNPGFCTFLWNMTSRSVSTADVNEKNMRWRGDCIGLKLHGTKADQAGEYYDEISLYSNWNDPHIDLFRHLALIIACNIPHDNDTGAIFRGDEERFSEWLKKVLSRLSDEDLLTVTDGYDFINYGTHSWRKGAISYLGSQNCASIAAIFLRASWSFGKAQDSYFFMFDGMNKLHMHY